MGSSEDQDNNPTACVTNNNNCLIISTNFYWFYINKFHVDSTNIYQVYLHLLFSSIVYNIQYGLFLHIGNILLVFVSSYSFVRSKQYIHSYITIKILLIYRWPIGVILSQKKNKIVKCPLLSKSEHSVTFFSRFKKTHIFCF